MTEWTEVVLGEEIDLAYGKSLPAHARQPGPFAVFGSNGCVGHHTDPLIRGPGIIVGRKGSVGEVVYSPSDFWPIDTTYYVVNKGGHDWRFIYHLLSSLGLNKLNSHSAVPGLNREDVYSIPAKMPPKTEQEQIALALDTVQCGLEFESKAIQRSQELKRAAMRELFTRGLRGEAQKETEIGPAPESWDIAPIGRFTKQSQYGLSIRGGTTGRYPILRMNCQKDGRVVLRDLQYVDLHESVAEAFRVNGGDILFNRTNSYELVGRTAIAAEDIDAVFASYLIRLSIDDEHLLPHYLNYFLNWDFAQSELKKLASRAVGQANINATKLSGFTVPVPPVDEQREIVAILDAIDRTIELHRRKRAVLDELFKALLHKLMTGAIRVADLDLPALGDRAGGTAAICHSGEGRNPPFNRSAAGSVDPGLRRGDSHGNDPSAAEAAQ